MRRSSAWGHSRQRTLAGPLVGLLTVVLIIGLFTLSASLFRGLFRTSVPVTVLSQRAGLVLNPDARVEVRGVEVGRVASIEQLPDDQAALHLAMNPARMDAIPQNAIVHIASSTVFGAKYVQFVFPPDPSVASLAPGQVIRADHVTVEVNTVFQRLTEVLAKVEPAKLNEVLGALAAAMDGRGEKVGRTLADLDAFLAKIEPSLPSFEHDLQAAPHIARSYADAAPNIVAIADNSTRISDTLVARQQDLDAVLISVIGLADIGTEVLHQIRDPLADLLHLLVPTTELTDRYRQALYCGVGGILPLAQNAPLKDPGVVILAGFMWGQERYRYPLDLPKAGATGGPQCTGLPKMPFEGVPPFVVTDDGTNPWRRTNPGIVLNADGIKRILFGEIDGPPRNSAQIGQPG